MPGVKPKEIETARYSLAAGVSPIPIRRRVSREIVAYWFYAEIYRSD